MFSWAKIRELREQLRKQSGLTIVEMMVVVTILGILSGVSVTLATVIMDANLRTTQTMAQQTAINNLYGYLGSRMASTNRGQIGYAEPGTSKVDPLTLAGDQLLFQTKNGEGSSVCYRMMYFRELDQIRVATAGSCTGEGNQSLYPKRGPNENVGTGSDPKYFLSNPGNSSFDPAIDGSYPEVATLCDVSSKPAWCPYRSWVLVDGVNNAFSLQSPENDQVRALIPDKALSSIQVSAGRNYLPLFSYLTSEGSSLQFIDGPAPSGGTAFIDSEASSASTNSTLTQTAVEKIATVQLRTLISALTRPSSYGTYNYATSDGSSLTSRRYWEQSFSLEQTCSITDQPSTGGGTGTGAWDPPLTGDIDGAGKIKNGVIKAGNMARFPSLVAEDPAYLMGDSFDGMQPFNFASEEGGEPYLRVTTPGRYLIQTTILPTGDLSGVLPDGSDPFGVDNLISTTTVILKANFGEPNPLEDIEGVEDLTNQTGLNYVGTDHRAGLFSQITTVAYLGRSDIIAPGAFYTLSGESAAGNNNPSIEVLARAELYWIGK